MSRPVMVFAPHQDDETLGCGGTIARRVREGREVYVVFITDGRNALSSLFNIQRDPDPAALKVIREKEAGKALDVLGVPKENRVFLGVEDGSSMEKIEYIRDNVTSMFREVGPDEVYLPWGGDINMDHVATHNIVKDIICEDYPRVEAYCYSISQKYNRVGPLMDRVKNVFVRNMLKIDVRDTIALKKKAMEEYQSQITLISPKQERPVLEKSRLDIGDTETFYVLKC